MANCPILSRTAVYIIDHNILIACFFSWFGVNDSVLDRFKSYLSSRTFHVKCQNELFFLAYFLFWCPSLPQGSLLGPLHFLLIGLEKQLAKIHSFPLNTTHSARLQTSLQTYVTFSHLPFPEFSAPPSILFVGSTPCLFVTFTPFSPSAANFYASVHIFVCWFITLNIQNSFTLSHLCFKTDLFNRRL